MYKNTAKLILLLLIFPLGAMAETRNITVQGEGRIEVIPDIATVSLGVSHQARTARGAMDVVAKDTRAVFDMLESFGIEERDIQTSGLSLHHVYERRNNNNEPPKIVGFSASTQIRVTARDLDRVGQLLDKVIDAGANNFQGINFGISDPKGAKNDARRAAVADALERAALYADAAMVELGEVIEISEQSSGTGNQRMIRAEAFAADSIPIAAGSASVTVQISMKIALK